MNSEQIIATSILAGALLLFGWGRYRYDFVALLCLVLTVIAGLVPGEAAFSGFGHPAVITVAAVLVISQALKNSGVVDLVTARLAPLTSNRFAHIFVLTAVVMVASAFMNNVGALALMLPVALATASEHNRSPALLLMPLAFGSILGGMTTMIGTPPNIIVASYRREISGEAFSLFDYSPVGIVVAAIGIVFIALIGWRLIPKERLAKNPPKQLFEVDGYLSEIRVAEDSPLIGRRLAEVDDFQDENIDVIGYARGKGAASALPRFHELEKDDILIARIDPAQLPELAAEHGLEVLTTASGSFDLLSRNELAMVEGIITPGSPLDGRDFHYLRRRTGGAVALIAIARQGRTVRKRLRRQKFKAGDVLLIQGDSESMDDTLASLGLLPLKERGLNLLQPRRVTFAVGIFAIAIACSIAGLVSTPVAFVGAVLVYAISGLIPVRDAYKEIDWSIIVLLGAMIPVGQALEATGTTRLMADTIVGFTGGMPVFVILGLILVVTMFLSDIVNNAATALIMAPIAVGIAQTLGVNTDAFLMAVAVGASCAFLTPIGHQSNTLVMGPGGYRFGDYWRLGLPLEFLIVLVAVPMIILVWPL